MTTWNKRRFVLVHSRPSPAGLLRSGPEKIAKLGHAGTTLTHATSQPWQQQQQQLVLLRAGAGKAGGSDETKGRGQRRWAESGKEVLGSKRRGTRYNGMQSTTYGIVDECTYRVFRGSEGAWVGGYGCAMAGLLGGCTSDRTGQAGSSPQAPGTDRSAWADGAGFPDGRWPFRTWSVGWPVGASRTSTPPPPVESLAARCVGGTAGPSIASQETLGRGGELELRPSSLGWVGLWFGQDGNS